MKKKYARSRILLLLGLFLLSSILLFFIDSYYYNITEYSLLYIAFSFMFAYSFYTTKVNHDLIQLKKQIQSKNTKLRKELDKY
jgi:uncharacterized membrane protein